MRPYTGHKYWVVANPNEAEQTCRVYKCVGGHDPYLMRRYGKTISVPSECILNEYSYFYPETWYKILEIADRLFVGSLFGLSAWKLFDLAYILYQKCQNN